MRHGQSTWNSESRFTGQVDVSLSELGQAQAQDLARRCANRSIDAVITSDLQRANVTGPGMLGRSICLWKPRAEWMSSR